MKKAQMYLVSLATVAMASLISFKSANENLALSKTGLIVADWQRAKAYTLEYLSAADEELIAFKPTEDMRTFGQQMLHISESNYSFGAAASGKTSPVIAGQLEQAAADYKSKEALTEAVMTSYDFVISALKEMDESKMRERITIFNRFHMTREAGFSKAFEHQTHHRGETTVYLRLMGIKPPSEKLL